MVDNLKPSKKLKLKSNSTHGLSHTSQNFMKPRNSIPTSQNNEQNLQKYLTRESLLTKYQYEHRIKISEGNKSLANKLKSFDQSYESTIRNTNEEKRNQDQFHKLYEKLKRETEDYLKKKEGKTYEDLAFADLIAYYRKIGYKIPNFSKDKNLFDASPLLLPNEKISDYYSFVEKLEDLVETKLKKNFYKDLNLLHDLTHQVNVAISGQENHKIFNIDKESNMRRLNRIRTVGTRKEMVNIIEHINKIKASYKDFKHSDSIHNMEPFKETYYRRDSIAKQKGKEFIEKNEIHLKTMHNIKSRGDVILPLPASINKKLEMKATFKNNKFLFNHSGNDSTNEALSTYFDTKTSFNHSNTIAQPYTHSAESMLKHQETKGKFNSTKLSTKLDLLNLKNGGYLNNAISTTNLNKLNNLNNPNSIQNFYRNKNYKKMSSKLSRASYFSDASHKGKISAQEIMDYTENESSKNLIRKNKNEMLNELFNKTSKDSECFGEIKNYFRNYSDKNVDSEGKITPHDLIKNFNEMKSKISYCDFNEVFKNFLNSHSGHLELNTDGLTKLKQFDEKILNSQFDFVRELNKKNL